MDRQATYPDQLGVRPLTIDQVAEIVIGRIKTAFAPPNEIDDPETTRKAEWVVNDIDKWGEQGAATTFQWLIERGQNQNHTPTVWLSDHPDPRSREGEKWTEDPRRAFMFPTREEGEQYARDRGVSNCDVVEHGFTS